MVPPRSRWINITAAIVGGFTFGYGIAALANGPELVSAFWAVLGFLVLGWAVFDLRRFSRGTPESEVDGGHTIE